jgi:predicted nucleic acid-binding protein
MSDAFVDTDILIRFVTGDDPVKQAAAIALFWQVEAGNVVLRAPDTVIADAVFVLCSPNVYRLPRAYVRTELVALLRLPGFKVHNRRILLRALEYFVVYPRLDFGDAMIVAPIEQRGADTVYTHDRDFDRVPGIRRVEP